jgi:3-oxoacyl-[acyl-carrier protein] reductase
MSDLVQRRFEGRNFLVTGASRGIGAATAEQLMYEGARVIGTATSDEGVASLNDKGIVGVKLAIDLSTVSDDVRNFWTTAENLVDNTIDGLVLNAGISGTDGLFMSQDLNEIARVVHTNTTVPLMVAQCAFRGIMKSRGSLVVVSSIVGQVGHVGQVPYATSKGAWNAAVKSMAMEARKSTIRNAALGYVDTDMTSGYSETQQAAFAESTRMGRAATPSEAAAFILNLSMPEAFDENGEQLSSGATAIFNVKDMA